MNELTGSIPTELGNLTNINFLQASNNQLNGSIPEELGSLSNINHLIFSNNNLSGCYPASLFNLCSIQTLNFSGNIDLPNVGNTSDFCSLGTGTCCNADMSPIIGNPIDSGIHASDSRIRMRGSLEQSAKYIFRATNRIEIRNSESIDIPQTSEVDFVIGECIEN